MAYGPGKYDAVCTEVRERTGASGVIVLIIDGDKGSGFSCQASPEVTANLPAMLESMAKQIRESGH